MKRLLSHLAEENDIFWRPLNKIAQGGYLFRILRRSLPQQISDAMKCSIDTDLVHAGDVHPRIGGAVRMPVFQSAMFEHGEHGVRYIRYNNTPNQQSLNRKLAVLEGADEALVTGSGMAAISGALLSVLSPGDHLLAQDGLYGGTHGFATRMLHDLGIEVTFFDADSPDTWEGLLRPQTRAVYVESITNPLLQVCDLERIVDFAASNKLISMIDNTFATPINYRAAGHGFDLSLHSATKYLNGHSDIVAGAVIGRGDLVRRVDATLRFLGGPLDPHACFLLDRGLQTLALRVRHQNESARNLATFLEAQPQVAKVNYPGLQRHPRHARARRLFDGFGGMISFELGIGVAGAEAFIDHLQIPLHAPSLGGVESLVTRPAMSSHASLSQEERLRVGIADDLIRLSVGIEAFEDLRADLAHALALVEAAA